MRRSEGPTTDEIVAFLLANGAEQPDAANIKYFLYGTGQEHVKEQHSFPCSHGKEIVNGRWGCLDCYKQLRKKEDVWLKKMTNEDRDAQLKKTLEHNKHCWEQLEDWTTPVDFEHYYDGWAKKRRNFGYRGDRVKYVRFDPKLKNVKIGNHYHGRVPCPQGRKINGTRLCRQHWQQNREDNCDLANERYPQRKLLCNKRLNEAKAMMGGFAATCPDEHSSVTFRELCVEFDHAIPPPPNGFDGWDENREEKATLEEEAAPEEEANPENEIAPEEKATPKEKASTRILKKMTNPFSSK